MRDISILVLFVTACGTAPTDTADTGDTGTDTGDTADTGDTDTGEPYEPPAGGRVGVCVTTDAPEVYSATGVIDGTIAGGGEGYEPLEHGYCWASVSRHLDVVDGNGVRWRAGWSVVDDAGVDVTPPVQLETDGPVQLRSRESCGQGCSAAFSLLSGGTLVAAFNAGYWGAPFQEGDLPGLTVEPGAELGRAETGCGLEAFTTMVFTGDAAVELEPYATGPVMINGVERTAWAAEAHSFVRVDCTDIGDSFAWAVSP